MRWALSMLVVVAGCPGPEGPGPDAPIASTSLRLAWIPTIAVPGPIDSNLSIERMRLDIKSLRVIGDTGTIDAPPLELRWDDSHQPELTDFANSAAGIYSRVAFDLAGASNAADSLEIEGSVRISGNLEPFRVEKLGRASVTINAAPVTLMPGDDVTRRIAIDVTEALEEVDFSLVPLVGGRRVLEAGDPQADEFLEELVAGFVDDP